MTEWAQAPDNAARKRRVVFAMPFLERPHPAAMAALEAALPAVEAAGWSHGFVTEVGNPYISAARAVLLHKALADGADVVFFLDYDLAYPPDAIARVLETEGDVVAGCYRTKTEPEEFMGGFFTNPEGIVLTRESDGAIAACRLPAGFLKITRAAIERFMRKYPELVYGSPIFPYVDLFNHGARDGMWWGEDYAFTDRFVRAGGHAWCVPDIEFTHYKGEVGFTGSLHEFLRRQPGGDRHGKA